MPDKLPHVHFVGIFQTPIFQEIHYNMSLSNDRFLVMPFIQKNSFLYCSIIFIVGKTIRMGSSSFLSSWQSTKDNTIKKSRLHVLHITSCLAGETHYLCFCVHLFFIKYICKAEKLKMQTLQALLVYP